MKARLSSTIWLLVLWAGVAPPLAYSALAYHAGKESGGVALLDASSLPGAASSGLCLARLALAVVAALTVILVLSKSVIKPVGELAKFSE